ncbi:MAG: hypothetical protein J7M14_08085, partial [Planctomycetes bacterium]|nr:hypothetical protein [Planctomycetota bacterium]
VGDWRVTGAYTAGTLTADTIGYFRSGGNMGANVTTTLNGADEFVVNGNFTGNATFVGDVGLFDVASALSGNLTITRGDLDTLNVASFSGAVSVTLGHVGTVTVSNGNMSGAFSAGDGLDRFDVASGNFTGTLTLSGDLAEFVVTGNMTGATVVVDGSIANVRIGGMNDVYTDGMNGSILSATGDVLNVTILGDMWNDSRIYAGYDSNADVTSAGRIELVHITGDMGRHGVFNTTTRRYVYTNSGAAIGAGLSPGADGYLGSAYDTVSGGDISDDTVSGVGYVERVIVDGRIFGTGVAGESYGVFAASNMPDVTADGHRFVANGNAHVGTMATTAANLIVDRAVDVGDNYLTVWFNHPVNTSTITSTTFEMLLSTDGTFDGSDTNVSAPAYSVLSYDEDNYTLTLTLKSGTWQTQNLGLNGQLTIDGSVVADNRGNLLDGDDDGNPGDDYVLLIDLS